MSISEDLLQKFIDCALSDEERAELEKQLTAEELERLKKDKSFQDALAEKLKTGPCCPDPLWQKLKGEMMGDVVAEQSSPLTRKLSLVALIAVCVGLVGMIIFGQPGRNGNFVSDVYLVEDVESYARQAEIQGSATALVKNLHRNGFKGVVFGADSMVDNHPVYPLGIRYQIFKKQRVAQILFECCNKPVIVLVAPKDLPIDAHPVQFSHDDGGVLKEKVIGEYKIIGGAQDHVPDPVLSLFSAANTTALNVR